MDEVCVSGMFVYDIKHKRSKDGHAKTESYIDSQRRLGARYFVMCFQDEIGANAYAETTQLKSLRVSLSCVTYRKWKLRGMDFSRTALYSKPQGREIYAAPPLFPGKNPDTRRELTKPLYGLSTARRDWYGTLKDFLTRLGGGGDIAR